MTNRVRSDRDIALDALERMRTELTRVDALAQERLYEIDRLEAERDRLYNALVEARPYIFNRTQGDDWRAETARNVLMRIDAALAANKEGTVI
jgi:hypothetical protein